MKSSTEIFQELSDQEALQIKALEEQRDCSERIYQLGRSIMLLQLEKKEEMNKKDSIDHVIRSNALKISMLKSQGFNARNSGI